jgi:hypothetical protein
MVSNWKRGDYHPSAVIKGVQILLLIVIIIGIGLILTQNIWVPKLVDYLLQTQKTI